MAQERHVLREQPLILLPPTPSPTLPATLIFVHGYNARASLFNPESPSRYAIAHHVHNSPALQHVKIIIPEALPCIHASVPGNVWYNISKPIPDPGNIDTFEHALDTMESQEWGSNEEDMKVSMDYFEELINSEVASGTPISRIVLMGYSQGGGIVTLFLLTRKMACSLGAVISHAGFSPAPMKSIYRMQHENQLEGAWCQKTKFFMLHGKDDVFVQREIFDIWRTRLEMFRDRGNGIAEMEWEMVDETRHAISVNVWLHVINILKRTVPLVQSHSTYKL
jgi:predicted esterase